MKALQDLTMRRQMCKEVSLKVFDGASLQIHVFFLSKANLIRLGQTSSETKSQRRSKGA